MRVAILSDTHGVLDPRVLSVVEGCDLAVHCGDIGAGAVLDRLAQGLAGRGGRVVAVLGNNDTPDRWPPGEWARLCALSQERIESLPGGPLAVVHGDRIPAHDRHERLRRRFPQARVIVYGHSHRLTLDLDREPWVLNPGAAGRSRTFGGPSCLVLCAGPGPWALESYRFEPPEGARRGPSKSLLQD